MKREDMLRKVRSLLALAETGSGATDPERETARRFADQLMQKHGLGERDIPRRGETQRQLFNAADVSVFVAGFTQTFGTTV